MACEWLEARIVPSASSGIVQLSQAAVSVDGFYSGGVFVSPNLILTPYERIPRFAANPTITSVQSGDWTDPGIWFQGRVPTDNDRVVIAANMTVNYATTNDAHLNCLELDGALIFSTSVDTRMVVGTLTVMPTGTLQIGTAVVPVAQGVEAELVIADQPLDLINDPQQFGTGLIALGTVTIHGSAVNKTWNRLGAEPHAGDTSLLVTGDISGWRTGDELMLPDSRQVLTSETKTFAEGKSEYQDEGVVIDSIVGNRIYLTSPLRFSHPGARNAAGVLELLPHVALCASNVVMRSENPVGTRGHTLFTARAKVDIRYTGLKDLGRTDNDRPLDNSVVSSTGLVSHLGTNQTGRHAVYFDHLIGPENPSNTGYQYQFIGNSIEHTKKWGVAINDSSYGQLSGNMIYDADGAGFVTCSGTEIGNVFSLNVTISVHGTYDEHATLDTANGDYARGGSGFWFRRGGNTLIANVATGSTYGGFVIDGYYNIGWVRLPKFRGADVHLSLQVTFTLINPTAPFAGNEAYGMTSYGVWLAFISGNNLLPNQPRTQIVNTKVWNVLNAGVRAYHTSNVTLNNLLILGDQAAQNRNDAGTRGVDLQGYENRNFSIVNSRIEGVRTGIIAPNNDATRLGLIKPSIVQNTILQNYVNVLVMPGIDNRPSSGASLVLRDVMFASITTLPPGPAVPSSVAPPANIQMKVSGFNQHDIDLTQTSRVLVYNYNQVAGDDFQVFYPEQAVSYVMPQTDPARLAGRESGLIGSPEQGLTNGQNWMKYGIAVAGSIAPLGALASRPEIKGLVGPIQNVSAMTPRVGLATPWNGALIAGAKPVRIRYNMSGVLAPGASVYFVLDNGAPFATFHDGGLYNVAPGSHALRVYIGDSNGAILTGTGQMVVQFTVAPEFGSSVVMQVAAAGTSSANAIVSALAVSSSVTTLQPAISPLPLGSTDSGAQTASGAINSAQIPAVNSRDNLIAEPLSDSKSATDEDLLSALSADVARASL